MKEKDILRSYIKELYEKSVETLPNSKGGWTALAIITMTLLEVHTRIVAIEKRVRLLEVHNNSEECK